MSAGQRTGTGGPDHRGWGRIVTVPAQDPTDTRWAVVLPVKGGAAAKSRLTGPTPRGAAGAATTAELALAMSTDCLAAVLATPAVERVVVVTGDDVVRAAAAALGAVVVHQPDDDPGLAAAVRRGLRAAGDGPTAVLLADLPALRPQDLQVALAGVRGAGGGWAYVPDARGEGTVMVAALEAAELRPAFGPGSAAAHRRAGAIALPLALPRLRHDVDTLEDLQVALSLGVGPRTARTLSGVQATVLTYDPAMRTGEVVTDAGTRLPMAPDALEGSGLRHLRPGQRVTCTAGTGGEAAPVTRIRIHGIES